MKESTSLSVMDFKIAFDRADRNVAKHDLLVTQISQIREEELQRIGPKHAVSTIVGTDLRNI